MSPPLATRVLKDLTRPIKNRVGRDEAALLNEMANTHFFEVTAVRPLAREAAGWLVVEAIENSGDFSDSDLTNQRLCFLPAPKTWIEWRECDVRHAIVLHQRSAPADFGIRAFVIGATKNSDYFTDGKVLARDPLFPFACAVLSLINSPQVVGRTTRYPHAALQRRLNAARPVAGSFPLRAWTELVIKAGPPRRDDRVVEGNLTAERPLHFVRAYRRPTTGVLVSSHWRGNGALGIKQTRYRVEPLEAAE